MPTRGAAGLPGGAVRVDAAAVPFLSGTHLNRPSQISELEDGGIAVLDRWNHRICIFNDEGLFERQVGSLGQGPGGLFVPHAYAIGGNEEFFVLDGNNWRLQIFSQSGSRTGGFATSPKSPSIAVTHQGEIYLNYPKKGTLVSIYSRDGDRLRGFGELIGEKAAYPTLSRSGGKKVAYSRIHMSLDEENRLYAAFLFAPLVRKYDARGRLLWEHRLRGGHIEELLEKAWDDRKSIRTVNMDGEQLGVVVQSAAYDPSRKRLYLLLNMEGPPQVYVLDETGQHVADVGIKDEGSLESIGVVGGSIAATTSRRCLRLAPRQSALRRFPGDSETLSANEIAWEEGDSFQGPALAESGPLNQLLWTE